MICRAQERSSRHHGHVVTAFREMSRRIQVERFPAPEQRAERTVDNEYSHAGKVVEIKISYQRRLPERPAGQREMDDDVDELPPKLQQFGVYIIDAEFNV
jgi:hypothetical protein